MTNNTATPAADTGLSKYGLYDLRCEIGHLVHLIGAIYDILNEMDYGTGATRNHNLERVAALTWIARGLVERLDGLALRCEKAKQ